MSVIVITPPAPLVSLALAKQHLRVDGDDQNAILESRIAAASADIDGPTGSLGRAIGTQTLEWRGEGFPTLRHVRLPYDPVQSIETVTYLDSLGVSTPWDPASYSLAASYLHLGYGLSWPTVRWGPGAVAVRYVAGFQTVPQDIVNAVLLGIEILHDRPVGPELKALQDARDSLLAKYRNKRV